MTEHDNPSHDRQPTDDLPNLLLSPYFQEQYKELISRNRYLPSESDLGAEVGTMFDDMEAEFLYEAIVQIESLIENGEFKPFMDYLSMIKQDDEDHHDTYNPEDFCVVTLSTAHVVVVEKRSNSMGENGRAIYILHFIFLNEKELVRSLLSVPPSSS